MTRLAGRVAVVTGGSNGIGRAIAVELGRSGCDVALIGTSRQRLDESLGLMPADCVARAYQCDVSNQEQVHDTAAAIEHDFSAVHIVVNNAGITAASRFLEYDLDTIERIVNVNLLGVIYGCHAFLPRILAAGGGHVANMSSMLGFFGVPNQSAYVSTKFAIRGFTNSLWSEYRGSNVNVTGIYPGMIQTDILASADFSDHREKEAMLNLMDRVAIPAQDAARAAVRGIRRNRREVVIGKDARALVTLNRLVPNIAYHAGAAGLRKLKEYIHRTN